MKRTCRACSRVNLGLGRGAVVVAAACTCTGAAAVVRAGVSGSVRTVTCELSTADVSNTEGLSGEAERARVMAAVVRAVKVEEGGDLYAPVSTEPERWPKRRKVA